MDTYTLTNDMSAIDDDMRALAAQLVNTDTDSPVLHCDWCGLGCETHVDSYDDTALVILDLLAHAAFDHPCRSVIIEYRPIRLISFGR